MRQLPISNPVALAEDEHGLRWWCAGCDENHAVRVQPAEHGWEFNGDYVLPTLNPSVLVFSRKTFINATLEGEQLTAAANIHQTPLCHSWVRRGRIQYLGDSTHELAGQTIPMRPLP